MQTAKSHPLPKNIFDMLAQSRGQHSVSIYLPMDIDGKEQNEHIAQAKLKGFLRQIHKDLATNEMPEENIKNYVEPLQELLVDSKLWRNPSQGIAIFRNEKELHYFLLPIPFKPKYHIASQFYLQQLFPLYYEDGDYYVLELSQDYIALYKANRYSFNSMFIEDFAPDRLEKAVGFDFKPKMLQFRSGQNVAGAGSFHGHGEGKDDIKKELSLFFRAIDRIVVKKIKNTKAPLMLACTTQLFAMYRSVSKYPSIYEKHIKGDSEYRNKNELHKASWKLIKDYFKKPIEEKIHRFHELYSTPKTSYELTEIIPAAVEGKVETLFLREDIDLYGVYDPNRGHLRVDKKQKSNNTSLGNLASLHTFLNGGDVYFLKADKMPVDQTLCNAIYRY